MGSSTPRLTTSIIESSLLSPSLTPWLRNNKQIEGKQVSESETTEKQVSLLFLIEVITW